MRHRVTHLAPSCRPPPHNLRFAPSSQDVARPLISLNFTVSANNSSCHMPAPILLQPRPYARLPGKLLLLPLMPIQDTRTLPSEIWRHILAHAMVGENAGTTLWCWSVLRVNKQFRVGLFGHYPPQAH